MAVRCATKTGTEGRQYESEANETGEDGENLRLQIGGLNRRRGQMRHPSSDFFPRAVWLSGHTHSLFTDLPPTLEMPYGPVVRT